MLVANKQVKLYGSENSIGDPLASIIIYVGIVGRAFLIQHTAHLVLFFHSKATRISHVRMLSHQPHHACAWQSSEN